MLRFFRHHTVAKIFFYLNLLNILNLSVNFYEGNISVKSEQLKDPIDTLGELVYEWALDGDCDIIPDNSTEQEDKSLKKADWQIFYAEFPTFDFDFFDSKKHSFFQNQILISPLNLPPTPPPDLG